MKIQKYLIIAAALLVFSCNKGGQDVNPATDARVLFSQTGLVSGDKCQVTMQKWDGNLSGSTYTVTDEALLEGGDLQYNGLEGASFYAWYPAGASLTEGKLSVSVSANQKDSYRENDFRTAYATVKQATTKAVQLPFSHRLVELEISFRLVTATSVVLKGVKTSAEWDIFSNRISVPEQTVSDVELFNDQTCFRAIIPAQTISAGQELSFTSDNGEDFTYTFEEEYIMTEGKRFGLQITKKFDGSINLVCSPQMPWSGGIDPWI
ncbi:MAG: fimbrillin family protein [Candidatus Cryptobacteroides sp.]|nr:fimbrillin family protein [Candidatus Cryptobacteroides sp.]